MAMEAPIPPARRLPSRVADLFELLAQCAIERASRHDAMDSDGLPIVAGGGMPLHAQLDLLAAVTPES